jgi:hypothetical protein
MKGFVTLVVLASGIALVGCGREGGPPSSQAEQVVMDAAARCGGSKQLGEVSRITGCALVKLYDNEGNATVRGQQFTAYPRLGLIQAQGRLGDGRWHATVAMGGMGVVTGGDANLSRADKEQIENYLRLILHRLRGPMNLLGGGEKPVEVSTVFVAGRAMRRVAATGRPELAKAYFFDERYRDLRMIADGKDTPPGSGTVTVLDNQHVDGYLLPVGMEVVEVGQDSLIGRRTRLSVHLENVHVR